METTGEAYAVIGLFVFCLLFGFITGGVVGYNSYAHVQETIVVMTCPNADISWLDGKNGAAAVVVCPDGSTKHIRVAELE